MINGITLVTIPFSYSSKYTEKILLMFTHNENKDPNREYVKVQVYKKIKDVYKYAGHLHTYNLENIYPKGIPEIDNNYNDCLFAAFDNCGNSIYTCIFYKNNKYIPLSTIQGYLISDVDKGISGESELFKAVRREVKNFLFEEMLDDSKYEDILDDSK